MDQTDLQILAYLQKDGRKPYTEIAQALGISEGTVRNRVSRLIEDQVIRIVGLVDPYQLGFDAPAVIGLSLQPAEMEIAAARIVSFPEVTSLVMVSGEFDLILEVICRNREHLAHFLNNQLGQVPGLVRIQTFLVLRNFKITTGARPSLDMQNPGAAK